MISLTTFAKSLICTPKNLGRYLIAGFSAVSIEESNSEMSLTPESHEEFLEISVKVSKAPLRATLRCQLLLTL
jgi:hypothetical protein